VTTIRQFNASDTFSVIKIASETLTENYSPSLFNFFYENAPDFFLVAEQHHKIIGFIIAIRITPQIARIVMMSILPSYRNQHIGSDLLTALIKILKNKKINQICLEVRIDNKNAISFYKKHQFSIIDTIEKFYQNDEDAFMMRRLIQPD
jgi:ribosomal-protein-alanine acetyltransferase